MEQWELGFKPNPLEFLQSSLVKTDIPCGDIPTTHHGVLFFTDDYWNSDISQYWITDTRFWDDICQYVGIKEGCCTFRFLPFSTRSAFLQLYPNISLHAKDIDGKLNVVSQRLRSIINTDPSITALSITGKCIEDLEKKYVEYDWENMSNNESQEACISSVMYWEREEFERLGLSIAMLPSLKHLIVDEADVCYSNAEACCSKIAQSPTIQIVTFLNISFCWDTCISPLLELPNLTSMIFSYCEIGHPIDFATNLNDTRSLSVLKFIRCEFEYVSEPEWKQFIEHIKDIDSLTSLEFSCCNFPRHVTKMINQIMTSSSNCVVKVVDKVDEKLYG